MTEYGTFDDKCRICLEDVKLKDYPAVIRPCMCNDFVHKTCLDQQIFHFKRETCEVCQKKYIFNLYRKTKYVPSTTIDEEAQTVIKDNSVQTCIILFIGLSILLLTVGAMVWLNIIH